MSVHPFLHSAQVYILNSVASFISVFMIYQHVFLSSVPADWVLIFTIFSTIFTAPCVFLLLAALPICLINIGSGHFASRIVATASSVILLLSSFLLSYFNPGNLTFVSPAISLCTLIWSIGVILIANTMPLHSAAPDKEKHKH